MEDFIKTRIREYLNENNNKFSLLNLIFSEEEIGEIYKIKNKIANDYLDKLEIDPFSNEDNYELIDFIKNTISKKGIKISDDELKFILELINTNILI
jgi:hypothetical protein